MLKEPIMNILKIFEWKTSIQVSQRLTKLILEIF